MKRVQLQVFCTAKIWQCFNFWNDLLGVRTHSNKTTQEGGWGGEERARKRRYSLSTSDKPNSIFSLADEMHPLTETHGHTHTHTCTAHTVMLKNNPHSHKDNNEHITNRKR